MARRHCYRAHVRTVIDEFWAGDRNRGRQTRSNNVPSCMFIKPDRSRWRLRGVIAVGYSLTARATTCSKHFDVNREVKANRKRYDRVLMLRTMQKARSSAISATSVWRPQLHHSRRRSRYPTCVHGRCGKSRPMTPESAGEELMPTCRIAAHVRARTKGRRAERGCAVEERAVRRQGGDESTATSRASSANSALHRVIVALREGLGHVSTMAAEYYGLSSGRHSGRELEVVSIGDRVRVQVIRVDWSAGSAISGSPTFSTQFASRRRTAGRAAARRSRKTCAAERSRGMMRVRRARRGRAAKARRAGPASANGRSRKRWGREDDSGVRSLVLGTAGHIDHGKSALVPLTGTDRRLKEKSGGSRSSRLRYYQRRSHALSSPAGHDRFGELLAGAGFRRVSVVAGRA